MDIYEEVTRRIVEQMEQGEMPYHSQDKSACVNEAVCFIAEIVSVCSNTAKKEGQSKRRQGTETVSLLPPMENRQRDAANPCRS